MVYVSHIQTSRLIVRPCSIHTQQDNNYVAIYLIKSIYNLGANLYLSGNAYKSCSNIYLLLITVCVCVCVFECL